MFRPLGFALAAMAGALVLAPVATLLLTALSGEADIWAHLARYVLPPALLQTLLLLAGVAAVTAVTGAGTAWLVSGFRFPGRDALVWLLPLPLAVPTYIVAYVYADLIDFTRSLPGAVLVFACVLYPYVYLAARAAFQTQSAALSEAARVSGASAWQMARQVTFPLARPAIAVGLALALLETLNDIGASEYLGVQTLTLSIFTTWLNRGSLAGAAQIACVMLVFVALLIAVERLGRRNRAYAGPAQKPLPRARIPLRGAKALLALLGCAVPVIAGFAIPAAVLIRETVNRGLVTGLDPDLPRHVLSTVTYAACATAVIVGSSRVDLQACKLEYSIVSPK